MAELKGRILDGKYRLTRQVGEGGMGTVWEGEHTRIHNRVAIKLMHRIENEAPNILERFFLEAKAAGQIGHPNIVRVFDVGVEDDGTAFMVMELLNGVTLAELLKESGGLPPQRTIAIVLQILSALLSAHKKGIIHRDLKPDNVFLASDERGREDVKLLDFGLAKIQDEGSKLKKLTQPGTVVGTPHYLSPEQAAAEPDIDARLDIWAIGVMMYEMLTGQPPFDGSTYNEVIVKIIMHPPRPIRELAPQVPEALAEIISKAMAKDRAQRYSSAADLVRALLPLSENFFEDMGTTSVQAIQETAKQPSFVHKLNDQSPPEYQDKKPAPKRPGPFESVGDGILLKSSDDGPLFDSSDDIVLFKSRINKSKKKHVRLPQPKRGRPLVPHSRSRIRIAHDVARRGLATLLSIITKAKSFFVSRKKITLGVAGAFLGAFFLVITVTYSSDHSDNDDIASSNIEATPSEQNSEQPKTAELGLNAFSTKTAENDPIGFEGTEPTPDNSGKDTISVKTLPTGETNTPEERGENSGSDDAKEDRALAPTTLTAGGGKVALGEHGEASGSDNSEKDSAFSAEIPSKGETDTLGESSETLDSDNSEKDDETLAVQPSAGLKDRIKIEIEDLPPEARVYLNGQRRKHPIQIAKSLNKTTLKVICPGYLPHIQRITPSEDMKIRVYMKKQDSKSAPNKDSKPSRGEVRWKNNPFN